MYLFTLEIFPFRGRASKRNNGNGNTYAEWGDYMTSLNVFFGRLPMWSDRRTVTLQSSADPLPLPVGRRAENTFY